MVSSHVEIPSSSQRFDFILRDRNQNAVVFENNLKALVKDHHHHHHQLFKSPVSDENSENLVDSWIQTHNNNTRIVRLTEKQIASKSRVLASPVAFVARKEKSEESKKNAASSLVEIWEARLNRSNGGYSPSYFQSTASSSRRDSGVSIYDSHLRDGDSELADESIIVEAKSPDRTVEIESGSHGLVSNSGENKRGRAADLIPRLSNKEKLTTGDVGSGGISIIKTQRPCISLCSSSEIGNFPMVNFSPRLRGRQAFTDLLMQLERDRHRELDSLLEHKAVSKFTQRGRLQSMLRLRNLKRCLAIQDQNRSNAKITGLNRIESGSAVLHLREKFRANAENAAAATDQRKDHHRSSEMKNKTAEETEVTTENTRLSKTGGITVEASCSCTERLCKATLSKEKETVNGTVGSKMKCLQLQETRDADNCNDGDTEKKEEEDKTSPSACIIEELRLRQNHNANKMETFMQETPAKQGLLHESNEMDQCLEQQKTSYLNVWDEQEDFENEQSCYAETQIDWLSKISRPRRYWEELRKSRYLEVMNTRSEKEDIRRLLERRTVTDFLESGLREQVDRLLMSRLQQTHSNKHTKKWEWQLEEEEEDKNGIEEGMEEEQLTEGQELDKRDDLSQSSSSRMFASSPAGSWSSQDIGVSSTPVLSVQNPHSPEMELISGMRSQIQQLQQEMSLLRDSVKTCMDANATLQQSIRVNPLKQKCRVCNETQVEAVLYRCGHMCTCLKCANELHWSGEKCPICRAQIMDVVRIFFETRN